MSRLLLMAVPYLKRTQGRSMTQSITAAAITSGGVTVADSTGPRGQEHGVSAISSQVLRGSGHLVLVRARLHIDDGHAFQVEGTVGFSIEDRHDAAMRFQDKSIPRDLLEWLITLDGMTSSRVRILLMKAHEHKVQFVMDNDEAYYVSTYIWLGRRTSALEHANVEIARLSVIFGDRENPINLACDGSWRKVA